MVTPHDLVQAGLYPDEKTVIEEAMRILWQERPQLRIDWAIHQYCTRDISLGKAAALAGVSFDRMKELLLRHGIQPHLGAETIADAREEVKIIEQALTPQE